MFNKARDIFHDYIIINTNCFYYIPFRDKILRNYRNFYNQFDIRNLRHFE